MKNLQVSTHYTAVLIRHAQALGLDSDGILTRSGIDRSLAELENQWISNESMTRLIKEIWAATDDETMGFQPSTTRRGTWAIACEFMLEADTLGELLRRGARFLEFMPETAIGFTLEEKEHTVLLHSGYQPNDRDIDYFFAEFLLALWSRFPGWAIGETIHLNHAFCNYPRPPHVTLYSELLHCDVAFDQPSTGIGFHRRYLEKPILRTIEELKGWLRNSPADLLYTPGRESSVQSHLKGELRRAIKNASPFPAFEALCERLCMSPQVVRRRLAEEDTSYQKIKDSIRCDAARRMLTNKDLSIADVGARTGFSETAAFSRAFKKWTGQSPAQYRSKKS